MIGPPRKQLILFPSILEPPPRGISLSDSYLEQVYLKPFFTRLSGPPNLFVSCLFSVDKWYPSLKGVKSKR